MKRYKTNTREPDPPPPSDDSIGPASEPQGLKNGRGGEQSTSFVIRWVALLGRLDLTPYITEQMKSPLHCFCILCSQENGSNFLFEKNKDRDAEK